MRPTGKLDYEQLRPTGKPDYVHLWPIEKPDKKTAAEAYRQARI